MTMSWPVNPARSAWRLDRCLPVLAWEPVECCVISVVADILDSFRLSYSVRVWWDSAVANGKGLTGRELLVEKKVYARGGEIASRGLWLGENAIFGFEKWVFPFMTTKLTLDRAGRVLIP